MPSMHFSLASLLMACAAALAATGCHAPWSIPGGAFRRPSATAPTEASTMSTEIAPRAGSTTETPAAAPSALPGTSPAATPLPPPLSAATDPDLAGVLDKLQQVAAMDPGAHQALIQKLRETDPKFWPAVAEQFRASLAYHYELTAKSTDTQSRADAATDPQDPPPPASPVNSVATMPPSTPIGTLPDPRRAEADGISSEALAQSSPYVLKLPPEQRDATRAPANAPARFEATPDTYPIAAGHRPSASATSPATIQPTAYEEIAPKFVADQADLCDATSAKDWQQLVTAASDDLSHRVAQSPATTAEVHQHVSLRMLRLLAGQTEQALEPIPHISPAEQDYWSRQVMALATYLDHHSQPDDKRRAAASVTHLDEAVANLRDLGTLSLRNFTFCKNIYGYGAIEPYKEDRFSPRQEVSLYVEVENYHSRSTEKGFVTSLGSTYEILDEKGERVDGGEFPDVDDCCRSRRRDFHIQFGVTLPEKIAPGRYQFELVVRDRQSDKIAHALAEFEIRGNPSTPTSKRAKE